METFLLFLEFLFGTFFFIIMSTPDAIGRFVTWIGRLVFDLYKPLFVRPGEIFEIPNETMKMAEDKRFTNPSFEKFGNHDVNRNFENWARLDRIIYRYDTPTVSYDTVTGPR
jgi:hypothetical protein